MKNIESTDPVVQDKVIHSIAAWISQVKPNPTPVDICVQVGCHYEEVSEGMDALGDIGTMEHVDALAAAYKLAPASFVEQLANLSDLQKVKLLDALCDQIFTAVAVGTMLGMDVEGALNEVTRANWSKLVNGMPVLNEQLKVIRGPDYTPPELLPFIGGRNDTGRLSSNSDI